MQQTARDATGKSRHRVAEEHQRERGRQGETEPGCASAGQARAREPDTDADLARRRTRQKLAEGDEIEVGAFVQPCEAAHERIAEVTEMGDRPAERGESEP